METIKDRELTLKDEMVHVEFPRGQMETFVWLSNSGELANHYEFMDQFFMSEDEYSIKALFDLHDDMIDPFIDHYRYLREEEVIVGKEYEHLFVALTNKLEQCLATLKKVKFEDRP